MVDIQSEEKPHSCSHTKCDESIYIYIDYSIERAKENIKWDTSHRS